MAAYIQSPQHSVISPPMSPASTVGYNNAYIFPKQNPDEAARSRYKNAFSSQIFNPPPGPFFDPSRHVPPGKRRDLMTSELFGVDHGACDLSVQPGTFHPRLDDRSAREKKMEFLHSDVLPTGARAGPRACAEGRASPKFSGGPSCKHGGSGFAHSLEEDNHGKIRADAQPMQRRHMEMESNLFDRRTPHMDEDIIVCGSPTTNDSGLSVPDCRPRPKVLATTKITPTDFNWYTVPRQAQQHVIPNYNSSQRAYDERKSALFSHQTPERDSEEVLKAKAQAENEFVERERDLRKGTVHYSDLFGRSTPGLQIPGLPLSQEPWHPKHPTSVESRITINQEWTDAKTEMYKDGADKLWSTVSPRQRRHQEFNKARVTNLMTDQDTGGNHYQHHDVGVPDQKRSATGEPMTAFLTDNSEKVKPTECDEESQQVHQKHLRSSMMAESFYQSAQQSRSWEVAEFHVNGLQRWVDEKHLRGLLGKACKGGHLVKVDVETCPVSHMCKGRAKVVVRYNPETYDVNEMVSCLRNNNMLVETG